MNHVCSSSPCLNEVLIGNIKCNITSSSNTRIRCSLAVGSNLVYMIPNSVEVMVSGKGLANHIVNSELQKRLHEYYV